MVARNPVTSSRVTFQNGGTRIVFEIEFPGVLTGFRIDLALTMLNSRARFLLAQAYRAQDHRPVTPRHTLPDTAVAT